MELNFESISFVVAIASIILAVVSLIFSVVFYKWSDNSNKQTFELSKGIENNTKKIEDLFDRFYSDTFGLMKSNYEAMQSSIFKNPVSSGDSSFTKEEQIESIITSILIKSKVSTRDSICHFIDSVYPKKEIKHSEINHIIDSLHSKKIIYINKNLISIVYNQETQSDEAKK